MRGQVNLDTVEKNEYLAAGSGGALTATIAAIADEYHVVDSVHCSYAAACTGKLTIAFGGVTKWEVDIPTAGMQPFEVPRGLYTGTLNEACVLTMVDGSQAKRLTVTYR